MADVRTQTQPRAHFFDAPNPHGTPGTHKIAWYEWGSPNSPVIICVHGLTRNGRDFDYVARELSDHYRIICIDIAGRGKSDHFPQVNWYENGVYLQDVLALTEHLKLERFDWIGTSMGGIIGMMMAAFVPGKITRLVINDIGALIPLSGLSRIGTYVGTKSHFADLAEARKYLRTVMIPFGIREPAHWDHIERHTLEEQADGQLRLAYDPNIGEAFRLAAAAMENPQDISLWMLWDAIKIPCLILRGELSDILPHTIAVEMAAKNPQSTLVEFKGIGHAPTLMEDDQIRVVENWLQTTARN